MTDYSDVIGRSFTFAVFSDNRKLAKKIIDRACELQSFDILCGVANGILDIKAGLSNIDPKLCEEMECFCQKIHACTCDECLEDLK